MDKNSRIIITGAAGCLGQNTILLLKEKGYNNILALDKNHDNIKVLQQINPDLETIETDLAIPGKWQNAFHGGRVLLLMHAKITGLYLKEFQCDNESATIQVIEAAKKHKIPYIVHISSTVVISKADDYYTNTKKAQEKLVEKSGIDYCILRPALMFGWFDKKHLGWLSRFMAKTPVFPIPGNGQYLRQPLYVRDMTAIVIAAMEQKPIGKIFNITGRENINYIDIIRRIKKVKGLHTLIINIPYWLFDFLLNVYALFFKNPPFTSQQLSALTAGDYFEGDSWSEIFNIPGTTLEQAFYETFACGEFSKIVLKP